MTIRRTLNRRQVVGLASAGLAGAGLSLLGRGARASAGALANWAAPDLVVLNARIYTMDSKLPQAEAFAVKDGRFVALGATNDIKGLAGKSTQTIDAQHMTIVPGFNDSHNHAPGNELLYEVLVGNPYEVEFVTIGSIIDKLRVKAQSTPADTWVDGYFFDDTKVTDKRALTRQDLDKVSTQLPVMVQHRGGHTAFYNSKALQMASITKDTANPAGGTFDRDANGELTGRVTDRARDVFESVGKRMRYSGEEALRRDRDGLAFISKQFVRYGLTSVCHEAGNLQALQEIRARGALLHRVSYEAEGPELEAMLSGGMSTGLGDEWIRLGATCEHTADGSFSERTMALSVPYPGSNGYKGNVTESQEVLNKWCERVHRAGIQMNCHANGDVAIDHVLTAYERALRLKPAADARPKITHCTLITADLVRRIKAIGVVPALFTSYAYYNPDKFHFYGEELMKRCMAYRTLLDAGVPAAAGSDFDPGPFSPLMGIQGMVTRTGWNGEVWGANQRITVDEALRVNTLNGAYATREESIKGSITPGKLADFVMLAEDPHTIDPAKIKDIKIVRTVVGGRTQYSA
ncbi:MAG TPA: amidohydrolase [Steroidobacteraceae bacterium]|nr:amidohydrolase [Steroidobacteraceae bacterium]